MDATSAGILGFMAGISFWGWGLILLEVVILFPLTIYERDFFALISLIVFGVLGYFLFHWNIGPAILYNPGPTIFYVLLYLALGALWSVYRWHRFVAQSRQEFDEEYASFLEGIKGQISRANDADLRSRGITDAAAKTKALEEIDKKKVPDGFLDDWKRGHGRDYPPSPLTHKQMLITWIAFWPWSLAWYIIRDLFFDLIDRIYRALAGVYWRISHRRFSDVDKRLFKQ